jgi:hypothetical protein
LLQDWKSGYGKFETGKEPICTVVSEYMEKHANKRTEPCQTIKPPWKRVVPNTDTSLTAVISKKTDSIDQMKALANDLFDHLLPPYTLTACGRWGVIRNFVDDFRLKF